MLWSDFRAQVRRELEEATATVWADASLLYWANEGAKDVATQTKCMRDWQYTTTVVGQSSYDLPDRSLEVIQLFWGDAAVAGDRQQLDRQDFNDWSSVEKTSTGRPLVYAIDDDAIYLRPAPNEAHELSYFRYTYPADMTADGDSMPFSDRANAALNYYIKSKANEQIKDFDSASLFYDRYLREVDNFQSQTMKEAHGDRLLTTATAW